MEDPQDLKSTPSTPSIGISEVTPPSSPLSPRAGLTPKSPGLSASLTNAKLERSSTPSTQPSPLLLAIEELTPLNSRDEDSALYSDSDAASQNSAAVTGRGRDGGEKKLKKRSSSRRRRSDATEKSMRSLRSHSAQRDTRYPHATKIFRNLLILEQSLREQLQEQRQLRNRFTFFLATLAGMEAFTIYSLYSDAPGPFPPVLLKFIAFFIVVTLALFNLSGEYRRTIVIPRRFFASTNKGLRQLNLRLVKFQEPVSDKLADWARALLRLYVECCQWIVVHTGPLQYTSLMIWWCGVLKTLEIRAQARVGPTDVKLMMNPRAFNAEIREAWEMYRDEFWAREGSRQRHDEDEKKEKEKTKTGSGGSSGNVLDRDSLVEKHRKERKDRRRSKAVDDRQLLSPVLNPPERRTSNSMSPVLRPAKIVSPSPEP